MVARGSPPPRWHVVGILILGVMTVSTAAVLIRLAMAAAGTRGVGLSLMLAVLRVAIASILFLPGWRSLDLARLQPSALVFSIGAGLCLALHFGAWITSLSYTSVVASVTLVTTSPIWIALLSWIGTGERPKLTTALGIGLGLTGSAMVSRGGAIAPGSAPVLGNSLAVVGAIAASLYLLWGRAAQTRGLPWQTHAAIAYATATVVLLPLPLLWGTSYGHWPPLLYLWALLLALGPQAIGHTSFNWVVRWVSPTVATLTLLLEPLGASVLAFWIFGEMPERSVFAGAGVTLSGVAIAVWGNRSAAPSHPD